MIYILFSVTFSVLVSVLLKIARRHEISIEVAIGVNYFVATTLTYSLLHPNFEKEVSTTSWFIIAGLGILLPTIFVVMGRAVARAGIAMADAVQRLSLLIPIVAAFTIFGETAEPRKLLGVVVAFMALGCLLYKPKEQFEKGEAGLESAAVGEIAEQMSGDAQGDPPLSAQPKSDSFKKLVLLLFGVWAGYGTIDILFKQMAKEGNAFPLTLFLSFSLAGLLMSTYLVTAYFSGKNKENGIKFNRASISGGLLLGVLNFGNIYTYLKAHQDLAGSPSVVFAGMNIGVISLGAIVGSFLFKEKINRTNGIGILIAILAIVILFLK